MMLVDLTCLLRDGETECCLRSRKMLVKVANILDGNVMLRVGIGRLSQSFGKLVTGSIALAPVLEAVHYIIV